MNQDQIANELLETFEGIEWIGLVSWFADINETAEFYNISQSEAKQAHDLAYWMFINNY